MCILHSVQSAVMLTRATALTAHFTHQETRAREVVTCQRSESQEEAGRFLPEDHLFSNWE